MLTGVVMLETMWKTRHQDLIDLISPFVFYSVAKITSPQEKIDQRRTLNYVKETFGYKEMALAIIERVLRRNPSYFQKRENEYYLVQSLDSIVSDIEDRRNECEQRIQIIGEKLSDYLETHKTGKEKYNPERAFSELQNFFSRNGIFFGSGQLEEHLDEYKARETDYHIAQFLYKLKDNNAIEYQYAIDLVKGYFLQSAIYLQAGNSRVRTATYKGVSFYYDTPFLLRLLGYKTQEDQICATDLHKALKEQKGSFYYFPHTQREVINILTAYQHSIGKPTYYTLEGLDDKGYTSSDVDRLKKTWESLLEESFQTKKADLPLYPQLPDGTVDPQYVINDTELTEYLKQTINWGTPDAMEADVQSSIGIHKIRCSTTSEEIEHCKAVFVTTNTALANRFNKYYREKVNANTFPLLITDSDLAALTWIKCGSESDLPERQLLKNAYMATQPTPEVLEKFGETLDQMLAEGEITNDVAAVMRSSRYTSKELLFASFEGPIDKESVKKIEKRLEEELSHNAREDEKRKVKYAQKEKARRQLQKADRNARDAGTKARDEQLAKERKWATVIEIILIIACSGGLIYSLINSFGSIWTYILLVPFIIASGLSVIDTWKGKKVVVDKWLVKRANKTYSNVCEAKQAEYLALLVESDSSEISNPDTESSYQNR